MPPVFTQDRGRDPAAMPHGNISQVQRFLPPSLDTSLLITVFDDLELASLLDCQWKTEVVFDGLFMIYLCIY